MKRLLLHVGTQKTGSSAIQASLAINRDRLVDAGWDYPDFSATVRDAQHEQIGAGNGVRLAGLLGEDIETDTSWFYEKLSKVRCNVLLSSELFSSTTPKNLQQMRVRMEALGFRVTLLVYLRPQDEYLESMWGQDLKRSNETRSFSRWLVDGLQHKPFVRSLNWLERIRIYEEVFGRDNLEVGWYPHVRRQRANGLLVDFLRRIGLSPDATWRFPKGDLNPAVYRGIAEIFRSANVLHPDHDFSNHVLSILYNHDVPLGRPNYLTDVERVLVRKVFERSNKRLFRDFMPGIRYAGEMRLSAGDVQDKAPEAVEQLKQRVEVLSILVADLVQRLNASDDGR